VSLPGLYVKRPVLCSGVVTTSGDDREKDACPNCGTRVESTISASGEPLREATERRCPNCAKVLRREVGGEWTVDETAS
jgi:ribosomal protein S27AE